MMTPTIGVYLLCLLSAAATVQGDTVDEGYIEWHEKWATVINKIGSDPKLQEALEEHTRSWPVWDDVDPVPPFHCHEERSPEPPTSVNELRPTDIKVFAAFGDSISAGNGVGALTPLHVIGENRGEVYSIGGDHSLDESVLTLPNIFRQYDGADLKGYSKCHSSSSHRHSWFNVAQPGGTARSLPGQADTLIEIMRNDSRIDFEKDWKMLTIWVGGNDLCAYCGNRERYSPEMHMYYTRVALDKLHAAVPRMFVNLITMFDVSPVTNLSTGVICDILHVAFCDCAVNEETRPELKPIQMAYYEVLRGLVASGRYDTTEDFTVVHQPHQRDMGLIYDPETGEVDHSYFSPDCFHPSRKGHHGFAYMLWNMLFIPVGHKPFDYDPHEETVFSCPTSEHPYMFTNVNSPETWPPGDEEEESTASEGAATSLITTMMCALTGLMWRIY